MMPIEKETFKIADMCFLVSLPKGKRSGADFLQICVTRQKECVR